MEIEGTYSFNIAVVGPNDELNSKFLNVIAETHGRVDGVEFHQSKISRVAALVYWQPHEDSMSPILVSHSLKTANGAIVVMFEKNKKILQKYRKLIKENAGKIPVKEVIFKANMTLDEIGEIAFGSVKDLAARLIIEAEQKSRKEKIETISKSRNIEEIAGRPRFYIDENGMVSTYRTPGSIPMFQDEMYAKFDQIYGMQSEELEKLKDKEIIEEPEEIEKIEKQKEIDIEEETREIAEIEKSEESDIKEKPREIEEVKKKEKLAKEKELEKKEKIMKSKKIKKESKSPIKSKKKEKKKKITKVQRKKKKK